jgi:hypothetical protein
VKRKVRKFIDEEDPRNPLTDDKIAQMLKDEGIAVTRRSINEVSRGPEDPKHTSAPHPLITAISDGAEGRA